MRARDESVLHEILPPEERAIEAVVARYQRVAPAVTRFARSMSGNDELQVRLDGELVTTFTFGGEEPDGIQAPASYAGNLFGDPAWEEYMLYADADMRVRFPAEARVLHALG